MRLLAGLLATVLIASTSAYFRPPPPPPEVEESHFAYQEKSFRRALDECAEYLQVPLDAIDNLVAQRFTTSDNSLKCVVRCAGINAGWWNDTSGIRTTVIESYFQPSCDDTSYRQRTQNCLDTRAPLCQDVCSKAYESFLCYYYQYGNLKSSAEYIPLPTLERVQASIDCINILRVPRELIEQYSNGVFPVVPETQCLFRCQYLAEGLYDPLYGINLTRFYIRHFDQPTLEFLADDTRACAVSVLRASCDECANVYNIFNCFNFPITHLTSQSIQSAAQIILGQQTCAVEPLQPPRYNSITSAPATPYAPSGPYVPSGSCAPATPQPPPQPAGGCKYNCGY